MSYPLNDSYKNLLDDEESGNIAYVTVPFRLKFIGTRYFEDLNCRKDDPNLSKLRVSQKRIKM